MLARFCSLMRWPPTMIRAGSPGTNLTMKKTIEVIRNMSGTSVTSRVRISRAIRDVHSSALKRTWSRCCCTHALRGIHAVEEAEQDIFVVIMVFQMHGMAASRKYLQDRPLNARLQRSCT